MMNKRKILNGGKKKTQFGGPKERKAREACQKAMMAPRRVGFRPYQPDTGARKDKIQNKGKGNAICCGNQNQSQPRVGEWFLQNGEFLGD